MKYYVVAFRRGGFMGKRGVIEREARFAVAFSNYDAALEWADVLGGYVASYDDDSGFVLESRVEEPF